MATLGPDDSSSASTSELPESFSSDFTGDGDFRDFLLRSSGGETSLRGCLGSLKTEMVVFNC